MSQEILALIAGLVILVLLACGGGAIFLMRGNAEEIAKQAPQQEAPRIQAGGPRRLAAAARRRRQQAEVVDEQEEDEDEAGGEQEGAQPVVSVSRKSAYEERRRKKDDEREAKQLAEEEAAARKEAERQEREDAEAARWVGQIKTEEEGNDALDTEEQQGILAEFVAYIKDTKTVVLEDLAADFNMRVQDVIGRVQVLESEGRITGVMDDRGKFIYISMPEMEAVANYINQKGRVSIAELASKSNTFIDLESKTLAAEKGAQLTLDLDDEDQDG